MKTPGNWIVLLSLLQVHCKGIIIDLMNKTKILFQASEKEGYNSIIKLIVKPSNAYCIQPTNAKNLQIKVIIDLHLYSRRTDFRNIHMKIFILFHLHPDKEAQDSPEDVYIYIYLSFFFFLLVGRCVYIHTYLIYSFPFLSCHVKCLNNHIHLSIKVQRVKSLVYYIYQYWVRGNYWCNRTLHPD